MTSSQERFGGGVAVVTGSGSGIGEGLVRRLADLGAEVVVTDVDLARAESVAVGIREGAGSAWAHLVDVSDPDSVETLAADVFDRYGRVDLFISNAGIEMAGRIWDVDPARWRRTMGVNADGPFHTARSFVPRMIAQGHAGTFAIVSSSGAAVSLPHQGAYVASKHTALSIAECLLLDVEEEEGADLQVSVIMPNWVRSRLFVDASAEHVQDAKVRGAFESMAATMVAGGMEPLDAAAEILDGLARGDFWVLTDEERVQQLMRQRADMLRDRTRPAPPVPRASAAVTV